jgi:uncharacterized protein
MPASHRRPPATPSRQGAGRPAAAARAPAAKPLSDRERDELQDLLDTVPAPLEPLDVSMLDGFLCGVLLQPRHVAVARWLPHVTDAEGRPLPARFDAARLHALALRRHAELDAAIGRRQWFDPWVFELADDDGDAPPVVDTDADDGEFVDDDDAPAEIDAVYPWVAGFATALELFPDLMALDPKVLTEPLALVYRHLAPDDLEDADALLAEIDSLEPPADLADAVEGLVRATLLLADVSRPVAPPPAAQARRNSPSDR